MVNEGEGSNKPKDTAFVQQRLRAFQLVHTLETTIACLVGASLLFLMFGFVLYAQADKITEAVVRYDNACSSKDCNVTFTFEGITKGPIYIYYELRNFYQNHRKFLKSKSYPQLRGEDVDVSGLSTCEGALYGKELYDDYYLDGSLIKDKDVANPCGLFPRSVFNDTFILLNPEGIRVNISEEDIAWSSDRNYLYQYPDDGEKKLWTDTENEHFIVWMRASVTKNFKKLWGKLVKREGRKRRLDELLPGNYTLQIQNNYDVSQWDGEKRVIITNVNSLGGKNYFLGMIFVFCSILCCFSSLFFCGRAMISKKASLSVDQLSWQ